LSPLSFKFLDLNKLIYKFKIIWQYGKRGQDKQTVLTIGRTQIENNYRVRVINNSTNEEETGISFNYQKSLSATELSSNKQQQQQITENMKITSNNLEIRKLQLTDSGWYECQLPTKPTQINYVHLEVLSITYCIHINK
jgi:hypothetical protein